MCIPLFACVIAHTDPESFVRGGPNLTKFYFSVDEERESKYHLRRAIIGQPAKLPLNDVLLVGQW